MSEPSQVDGEAVASTELTTDGLPIDDVVAFLKNEDPARIIVRNEFACVSVYLRDPGRRPRLCIQDLRTGQTIELDAIELESLAWAMHKDLFPLLDPSAIRWVGRGD